VSDGSAGTSLGFNWDVTEPGVPCPDCLDFNVVTTSSYANQDIVSNVSVTDGGATLVLIDNTWRQTDQTFVITADTVLEFDFESNAQGEVHGIGFDEDDIFDNSTRIFQLYGTQNWRDGNHDFHSYASGLTHYQIPVGQYYQGSAMRLVFTNDNDAGSGNDSRFSNVRIINGVSGNLKPTISNPGNQTTVLNSSVSLTINATDLNPGDVLSFSQVGLPTGLSLNSSTGEITGTATTLDTFNVTVTVDDGNGGSDSASFEWAVYDPNSTCPICLDFASITTSSYANQDIVGNVVVADGGATLVETDNTWRQTDQTFVITANTILEFDFQSNAQGEIHGIGFDEDNSLNAIRIFQLYGTQNWARGNHDFDTYSGGLAHYQIPVGQYYQGGAMRLVFANDNDAGSGNDSRFSNVRIFEGVSSNLQPTISNPGDQITVLNNSVNLTISATDLNPGDILSFSETGLPAGLSLNNSTGEITGIATTLGTSSVTITVDDGNGGSDSATFDWFVCDPAVDCNYLDFNITTTSSYSNQDIVGNVAVADAGATLVLTDNTWRQTDQTFVITANTVLEFDFKSSVQGEVHGIGFDEDADTFNADRIFRLYGTQNWGIADFATYTGAGQVHYQIPIGLYYQGVAMRLVFGNVRKF
jgi:hypothetical protein